MWGLKWPKGFSKALWIGLKRTLSLRVSGSVLDGMFDLTVSHLDFEGLRNPRSHSGLEWPSVKFLQSLRPRRSQDKSAR